MTLVPPSQYVPVVQKILIVNNDIFGKHQPTAVNVPKTWCGCYAQLPGGGGIRIVGNESKLTVAELRNRARHNGIQPSQQCPACGYRLHQVIGNRDLMVCAEAPHVVQANAESACPFTNQRSLMTPHDYQVRYSMMAKISMAHAWVNNRMPGDARPSAVQSEHREQLRREVSFKQWLENDCKLPLLKERPEGEEHPVWMEWEELDDAGCHGIFAAWLERDQRMDYGTPAASMKPAFPSCTQEHEPTQHVELSGRDGERARSEGGRSSNRQTQLPNRRSKAKLGLTYDNLTSSLEDLAGHVDEHGRATMQRL